VEKTKRINSALGGVLCFARPIEAEVCWPKKQRSGKDWRYLYYDSQRVPREIADSSSMTRTVRDSVQYDVVWVLMRW
jgi:hypothetical protein